jgi:ABC-type transporter lipoprotein component MlaA
VPLGVRTVEVVNWRSLNIDIIGDLKRDSLDYYAAVRDAYLQRRADLIDDRLDGENEGKPVTPDEDDLYYPDDEQSGLDGGELHGS